MLKELEEVKYSKILRKVENTNVFLLYESLSNTGQFIKVEYNYFKDISRLISKALIELSYIYPI
jgi:hypothetical protein